MKLRCRVPQLAVFFVMGAVALPLFTAPAQAQEKNDYKEEWNNLMGSIGFGQDHAPIDYSPRPLIAVPPTYELPPPGTAAIQYPAGFPKDPDVESRRKALLDARRPLAPNGNPGPGKTRAYLIEPPAEYLDAAKVAATGHDAAGGDGKTHHSLKDKDLKLDGEVDVPSAPNIAGSSR